MAHDDVPNDNYEYSRVVDNDNVENQRDINRDNVVEEELTHDVPVRHVAHSVVNPLLGFINDLSNINIGGIGNINCEVTLNTICHRNSLNVVNDNEGDNVSMETCIDTSRDYVDDHEAAAIESGDKENNHIIVDIPDHVSDSLGHSSYKAGDEVNTSDLNKVTDNEYQVGHDSETGFLSLPPNTKNDVQHISGF